MVAGFHQLVGRYRSRLGVAAVVLAIIGVLVAWFWTSDEERRALQEMPAEQRRALYDDSLKAARAMCRSAESAPPLAQHCRESAELLTAFPECDAECIDFVRRARPQPAR